MCYHRRLQRLLRTMVMGEIYHTALACDITLADLPLDNWGDELWSDDDDNALSPAIGTVPQSGDIGGHLTLRLSLARRQSGNTAGRRWSDIITKRLCASTTRRRRSDSITKRLCTSTTGRRQSDSVVKRLCTSTAGRRQSDSIAKRLSASTARRRRSDSFMKRLSTSTARRKQRSSKQQGNAGAK